MSILKRTSPYYTRKKEKPSGEDNTSERKQSLMDVVDPSYGGEKQPPSTPSQKKRKKRSKARTGSPHFKRKHRVSVALSIPEYEALHHAAQARNMSISVMLRHALFEGLKVPRPHPERPSRIGQAEALDSR
jgi:hypothetical protein